MTRLAPGSATLLFFACAVFACGSSGTSPYSLDVGSEDAGQSLVLSGTDSGGLGALDAYIEENKVAVKLVTVSCSEGCATVQAVGTGGYPP